MANPGDFSAWLAVICWSKIILGTPQRGGKRHNLSAVIRKRVSSFDVTDSRGSEKMFVFSERKPFSDSSLADAIIAKLEDGNVRGAVRLLCSDDRPAPFSQESFIKLQAKHPSAPSDRIPVPNPHATLALSVDESDVLKAVRSFPAGSSAGLDGFGPQHLLDLVSCLESGADLLTALTAFVNLLLAGKCHRDVSPILFGGRLIAIDKKSGGIRPIAIGSTFRRVVAKCANAFADSKLAPVFSPRQLGVGIPSGCESAIHATRRFLQSMPSNFVVAKIDFSNAFNSLRRDAMLQAVYDSIPELYSFCHLAYGHNSLLQFGSLPLLSQEGAQQGDPLGPLLFCLTVHPLLSSLSSQLVCGFMDDFTLGGLEVDVTDDVNRIGLEGQRLSLHINSEKCELITHADFLPASPVLKSFSHVDLNCSSLLGAPLFKGQTLDAALDKFCSDLERAIDRLKLIESHDALVLLRSCFSAPKVQHFLRCSPCLNHPALSSFDRLLKLGISRITNCSLSDSQWLQASLPVNEGGLGVRQVAPLAMPAFLASAACSCQLQDLILSECSCNKDVFLTDYENSWLTSVGIPLLTSPSSFKQSAWDRYLIIGDRERLWGLYDDTYNTARLTAVTAVHSGDWLHALPISACGLRLDNEAVRVAVGLRLGVNLCEPHKCPCGSDVDARGLHGLACRLAPGRLARHHALNDLICRALSSAGLPSTKEPTGLSRTDGKRPDGLSLIPWKNGKPVTWDVTVIHPLAESYISTVAVTAGGAAELAADRKCEKYAGLPPSYLFQPIAFETFGTINSSAVDFISELGYRLECASGKRNERNYLFQRLSVCLQRFNSIAFKGSFHSCPDLD